MSWISGIAPEIEPGTRYSARVGIVTMPLCERQEVLCDKL